jgi:hypothetical protein
LFTGKAKKGGGVLIDKGMRGRLFLSASVFLFLSSAACAQSAADGSYNIEVDGYSRVVPSRAVKAQSGGVRISETKADCIYKLKLFAKLPLDLSIAPGYVNIYKTVSLDLPQQLTELGTDIQVTLPFFKLTHTYLRLGASPSFCGDNWTFDGEALCLPSRYFAIYQPDEKWTFIGGVAVFPRYEDSVFPILGFIYQASDKLTFNLVPRRPNINYALSAKTALFLEGGRSVEEYTVHRGDARDVRLRYVQERLGCGARYRFNKFIEASISTGAAFNHYLRYRDSGGKASIKNGSYTEFRIQAKI